MKTVFLDTYGLEDCLVEPLKAVSGELTMYGATEPGQVKERIADADVIILNKVKIGRELLKANPKLKLICVVATGTDVIDISAAKECGVTVCNCRAYGTDSVVQHVFSMLLALQTSLLEYHRAVQNGRWQQSDQFCFIDYPISELKGKTMGIVGFGTLGKGVARIAEAFGMKVIALARPGRENDDRPTLDELISDLDVLSLHCPLDQNTKGLIGAELLKQMKPSAFIINAARGGIVDEAALVDALKNGVIAGAATDVLSVEPPKEGNPLLEQELNNLIVTPHIAWASKEARQRLIDQTVENIEGWKNNKPVRVV